MNINFSWDNKKNKQLIKDRGVCFEDVVNAIYSNQVLDIIKHPNQKKYSKQSIYIIELMDYVYMMPYVKNNDEIFLKTVIPSRKMQKIYKR